MLLVSLLFVAVINPYSFLNSKFLYLKHHDNVYKTSYIIMDKKLTESIRFGPYEINKQHTLQYKLLLTTQ